MADKRKAGRPRQVDWAAVATTRATGLSVAEIARQFEVTESTVRNILRRIALPAQPPKEGAKHET